MKTKIIYALVGLLMFFSCSEENINAENNNNYENAYFNENPNAARELVSSWWGRDRDSIPFLSIKGKAACDRNANLRKYLEDFVRDLNSTKSNIAKAAPDDFVKLAENLTRYSTNLHVISLNSMISWLEENLLPNIATTEFNLMYQDRYPSDDLKELKGKIIKYGFAEKLQNFYIFLKRGLSGELVDINELSDVHCCIFYEIDEFLGNNFHDMHNKNMQIYVRALSECKNEISIILDNILHFTEEEEE